MKRLGIFMLILFLGLLSGVSVNGSKIMLTVDDVQIYDSNSEIPKAEKIDTIKIKDAGQDIWELIEQEPRLKSKADFLVWDHEREGESVDSVVFYHVFTLYRLVE